MNYTLITGASKGIGKALAETFAQDGHNLVLVARNYEALKAVADQLEGKYKIDVKIKPIDLLADRAVEELYQNCLESNCHIRMLINNAGFGLWGRFEELKLSDQLSMMHLNQQILIKMVYTFLPMLKSMPYAHILNVSSTAAFQPMPFLSTYASSKAFVLNFSKALRFELKSYKINVSCLCPGPTATEFFQIAGFPHKFLESSGFKMDPEEVARHAMKGLMAKKAVIVPGSSNRLGAFLAKHLSTRWMTAISGGVLKPGKTSKP